MAHMNKDDDETDYHIPDNMSDNDFKREVLMGIAKLQNQVTRLNTAVMGDDESEIQGIAQRTKKNEDYIEADKKLKWMGAGIFLVIAAYASDLKDFITHLFKH